MFGKKTSEGESAPTDQKHDEKLRVREAAVGMRPQPAPSTPPIEKAAATTPPAPITTEAKTLTIVDKDLKTDMFRRAKLKLIESLVNDINFASLEGLDNETRRSRVRDASGRIVNDINIPLNAKQQEQLLEQALDEVLGFGPIQPLLNNPDINDIMINGHNHVYVETKGKIYHTDVEFLNEQHLLSMIQRVVSRVGRRIDEASPMVDARMPDGSRFNAIIPPLALDGCLVSIRKFESNKLPLSAYLKYGSLSEPMMKFLELCANVRLNMIISGGTGSGKTTLLNALSGNIDAGERIVTIEDAAELQMHQPHVLRLETRPPSVEGKGEVTQRALVRNALRMRPDRIILGEIRGDEVIDVLSAMNTGHDGSMATIHANSPRDCISRIENLVAMTNVQLPSGALRQQIASAVQIIVQLERMRDGVRRITSIEEIVGVEGSIITTQTLFSFKAKGLNADGKIEGEYICHGIRPKMLKRAEYYGQANAVLECFTLNV